MKSWNELSWWSSDEKKNLHRKLGWDKPGWRFYPRQEQVYRALEETPFDQVKVVIVGQDPYPSRGMANGLAFSVDKSVSRDQYPPTLKNIFQELVSDLYIPYPRTGSLVGWARQGVLLWNTSLTVQPFTSNSHRSYWTALTHEVLQAVDRHHFGVVFILWGRKAQNYLPTLSSVGGRNHAIVSPHPSPLSASRGFLGSRPFSTANARLTTPVDWRL